MPKPSLLPKKRSNLAQKRGLAEGHSAPSPKPGEPSFSLFFVFLFYWQRKAIFVCLPSPICSSQPSQFCIFLKVLFYVTLLSNCPLSFVGRQYKDMGLSWVALALDEWKLFLQNCLFHLCLMSKACSTLPQ